VPRVPFELGFQMFLAAGLSVDDAIVTVNEGVRSDERVRRLDLWCDGTKMSTFNIREHVRIGRYHDGRVTVVPAGHVGWQKTYVFELDAEQVERLIAALQPDPTKAPPGRPPEYRWDEYIDPLIDIELERGGKNIAAVVYATLKHCKQVWTGIPLPSVRGLQARVSARRMRRN
jgi:hypothetical protein